MNMNVFKFSINIKSKMSCKNLEEKIINRYYEQSKTDLNYKKYSQMKWTSIAKEQIRAIYSEKAVIVFNSISNVNYYLVDNGENNSVDNVTYDVMIMSTTSDINYDFNVVYDDIKKILSDCKCETIEDIAYLFIYDGKDIITSSIMIKSNVVGFNKVSKSELWRYIVVAIILFIFSIVALVSIKNEDAFWSNISCSIGASCIFFIISELIVKVNLKKVLVINDLSNYIKSNDRINNNFNIDNEADNLKNPAC